MNKVQIHNTEQVKRFVNAVSQFPFDVTISNGRYKIDAKSIMGVFSLDTSKPCTVEYTTPDANKLGDSITDNLALQWQLDKQFNSIIEPFRFKAPIVMLVGVSGCGKSTIANKLYEEYGLTSINSYTTRKPRYDGELGHVFISDEEFDNIPESDMVAYTEFAGNRYCATQHQLEENDIYIIDPTGLINMNRNICSKKIITVYIIANEEECLKRMIERGNSKEEAWQRIYNDRTEFAKMKNVDVDCFLSNNSVEDLNYAVQKIYNLYCGEVNEIY